MGDTPDGGAHAVAVAVGDAAWCLRPHNAPLPESGTVPILDLVKRREPGTDYLVPRVWWRLAPLATASVRVAAAISAWSV